MSNETTVKNDADEAASHNESTRALTGKIAQLPKDVREELNCRLDDGQPASETLPWLNGLPAVKKILDKHFGGRPINERNLSLWRHNGHQRWLKRQEALAEFKELAEDAEDLFVAASGKVARIAVARILKQLQAIPSEQASVNDLAKISHAISALLNTDQNQARLEFEKTRVFQGNERLVLSWDKFLRDRVATAQRALKDAICKDIEAANIDNGEKIELMGHHMFGKKWYGRKVPVKKEVPKQAPEGPKKESVESSEKTDVQQSPEPLTGSPPHPTLSPDVGEGNNERNSDIHRSPEPVADDKAEVKKADGQTAEPKGMDAQQRVPTEIIGSRTNPVESQQASAVKNEEKGPIEKTEAGSPIKGEPTADQQVHPTMAQGQNAEAAVSSVEERSEELKISGSLTTAATKAEAKETDAQHVSNGIKGSKAEPDETAVEKTGMNIAGNLTTAATVSQAGEKAEAKKMEGQMAEPKGMDAQQRVPTEIIGSRTQRELSPYDKALLEGKTHLEAMYAQAAPVKNAQPKPPEDPSVPKPSPWDSFSEKVDVYSGFRPAPAINFRSALGRNTPG